MSFTSYLSPFGHVYFRNTNNVENISMHNLFGNEQSGHANEGNGVQLKRPPLKS